MDRSVVHPNSSNPRRTRTLPSWLSSQTPTSGTESQKNHSNGACTTVITSSPVTIKTEFTEYDDDTMSLWSSTEPEPVDVKPKIEDLPCSSTTPEIADVKPKIENLFLSSATNLAPADMKPKVENLFLNVTDSVPADIKPKVKDLPSSSSTDPEPADVKPKIEEIPIETVFVQEGDDTEFIQEDSATTVGTADSTTVDDDMLSDNEAVVSETIDPAKELKVENSTPQGSTSSTSASVASSPSALPNSITVPSIRRMCVYRHKCYRTNPQHKLDFSHPGDADYDGQPSDSTGDSVSKPRCWYGSNCYRKSEEHRQRFTHSPPNSRKRNVTQSRNATRVSRENTNADDDSDAYDDSFIDDDPVDDFGASDDDETEFSDFDSSSSSDEDSYRGIGRTKKKKFNIL